MKYFRMIQDSRMASPKVAVEIHYNPLKRIFSREEVDELDEVMAFAIDNKNNEQYPAVMDRPIYLVNSDVKEVLARYDKKILFRAVMLNDIENAQQTLYWLMGVEPLACVAEGSEFYPNKNLKKLVLDEKQIGNKAVFKVDGIFEQYLVIRLDVAESLLRREIYGIELTTVATDGGE